MRKPIFKFKTGDMVQLVPSPLDRRERFAAPFGAKAEVKDPAYYDSLGYTYLNVRWLSNTRQSNGGYYEDNFVKVIEDTFYQDGEE